MLHTLTRAKHAEKMNVCQCFLLPSNSCWDCFFVVVVVVVVCLFKDETDSKYTVKNSRKKIPSSQ